jgi:hypothetical protein
MVEVEAGAGEKGKGKRKRAAKAGDKQGRAKKARGGTGAKKG